MLIHRCNCRLPSLESVFVLIRRIPVRFFVCFRLFTISILMSFFPTILHERHTIQAPQRISGIACNLLHGRPITFVIRNLVFNPFPSIVVIITNHTVLLIILSFRSWDCRNIFFWNRSSVFVYLRRTKDCSIIVLERNRILVKSSFECCHIGYRLTHFGKRHIPTRNSIPRIGILNIRFLSQRISFIRRHFTCLHQRSLQDFITIHERHRVFVITCLIRCCIGHISSNNSHIINFWRPSIKSVRDKTIGVCFGRSLNRSRNHSHACSILIIIGENDRSIVINECDFVFILRCRKLSLIYNTIFNSFNFWIPTIECISILNIRFLGRSYTRIFRHSTIFQCSRIKHYTIGTLEIHRILTDGAIPYSSILSILCCRS